MNSSSLPHLNRRDFISGATAIGVSTLASSAAKSVIHATKIKAGVVGLGGRGTLIANALAANPHFEITALCDYFEEVVQEAGRTYGVAPHRCHSGLGGYRRLLDSDVDAVLLETPPCFFPEHVAASVEAGKHVLVAKPIACDVPGTLAVEASGQQARERGQVFLIDFQIPTNAFNQQVVQHVTAGALGPVSEISSFYCDQGFPDPPLTASIESRLRELIWVNDVNLGGGMLVNAGIHAIDAALWVAGAKPVWAMGASRQGKAHHGDTHDVYSVTFMLENGVIINHRGEHLDNRHEFICRNTVWGEDGYAELGYMGRAWVRSKRQNHRGGEVSNLYLDGITANIAEFGRCIREMDSSNGTLEKGIESNLAVILGREACHRQSKLTREQLLAEATPRPFNPDGLKA